MIRKKSGFMMTELMVVISIIAVLGSVFLTSNKLENNIKYQIESKYASSEMYNILTYAKCWCKKNNCMGQIDIDSTNNSVFFRKYGKESIKTIKIPKSVEIYCDNTSKTLVIFKNGKINKGTTISFKDKLANTSKVTVRVAVDKITIK